LNGRQILIKILPVKGDSATIIIMLTDITEYKRLEMQLQHMQKMEAIGTIAAGVAHNFRNTLTEILVNSQLIHMNYEDEGGLHQVADRINTSVKRGSRLVNGLLQFSRKQITQEFEAFNLSDIIEEIIQIIRKSFSQKIDIQTEVPGGLWIRGDATSLSQALMNLCNNARDAMPDGGKLIIRAFQESQSAIILVTDSGEGMDRETIGKCFDPFFTSKPLGKGTGLGLSTTFGIVKSHDGLITVDSQMGRGTTFRVQLPLAADTPQIENRKKSVLVRGKGELVLVVDDERDIRSSVSALIEYLGYRAETAADGKEGLAKFRSQKPDAVLMDINMPAMDGVTCIEEIFKFDPKANISLFTGYNRDIVEELSPKARASIKGYIPKPISLEALSQLLAKALGKLRES
jgi:hypothetical protein